MTVGAYSDNAQDDARISSAMRFYRAMLCIRGTSHGPVSVSLSVCVCLCLSQVGVLLKRLNVGSHNNIAR